MKKYYTRWVVKAAQLTSKMCLVNIIQTALVIEQLWDKTWQDIVASRMIFVAAAVVILHTRLPSFLEVICKSCASPFVSLFFFFQSKETKIETASKSDDLQSILTNSKQLSSQASRRNLLGAIPNIS